MFDSYRGELHFAGQAVEDYGYVFVMYYASWSARSMLARDEFSEAARIMYPRVRRILQSTIPQYRSYVK